MKYYVQNLEKGYCGNSIFWWRNGNAGYTTDLGCAQVFDECEDYDKLKRLSKDSKFRIWEKRYIDLCSSRTVDIEDVVPEYSGLNPGQNIDFPSVFEVKDSEDSKDE